MIKGYRLLQRLCAEITVRMFEPLHLRLPHGQRAPLHRYPQYGKRLKVYGSPWQFSETPAKIGIAPGLGEHNEEVLGSLGYDSAQIADLKSRKVI
jgi:crotonobetainyl-CoA:carnitine CoA-transferase CaiB-like acyl-CoA transferase